MFENFFYTTTNLEYEDVHFHELYFYGKDKTLLEKIVIPIFAFTVLLNLCVLHF